MQQQLCRIPKTINFQYHQGQQLNATIILQNLLDKIISFKIKSNKTELYLVKPMQGSIYKHESMKITFKRKDLQKSQFEAYLRNPSSLQQKFLIQVKSLQQDVIGLQKILTQSAIVVVKFSLQNKQPQPQPHQISDQNRQQLLNQLNAKIKIKKNQSIRLDQQIKLIQSKINRPKDQLTISKLDIINLFIVFFLVGFAIGV